MTSKRPGPFYLTNLPPLRWVIESTRPKFRSGSLTLDVHLDLLDLDVPKFYLRMHAEPVITDEHRMGASPISPDGISENPPVFPH